MIHGQSIVTFVGQEALKNSKHPFLQNTNLILAEYIKNQQPQFQMGDRNSKLTIRSGLNDSFLRISNAALFYQLWETNYTLSELQKNLGNHIERKCTQESCFIWINKIFIANGKGVLKLATMCSILGQTGLHYSPSPQKNTDFNNDKYKVH